MSLRGGTPTLSDVNRQYQRNQRIAWGVALLWGAAVSALHFAGLAYGIYTELWWWDLLTHFTSGFGVAALLYLAWSGGFSSRFGLFVVLPVCVLCIGTWFEVYERLFKDFWLGWSDSFYIKDTITDLVVDTLGALTFGVVFRVYRHVRRS
jgi:hypothetical protein